MAYSSTVERYISCLNQGIKSGDFLYTLALMAEDATLTWDAPDHLGGKRNYSSRKEIVDFYSLLGQPHMSDVEIVITRLEEHDDRVSASGQFKSLFNVMETSMTFHFDKHDRIVSLYIKV